MYARSAHTRHLPPPPPPHPLSVFFFFFFFFGYGERQQWNAMLVVRQQRQLMQLLELILA